MISYSDVPTYTATIYVGLLDRERNQVLDSSVLWTTIREYCNQGLCMTVTPTTYVYKGGQEPGLAVGLINYPRFPADAVTIRTKALQLAEKLLLIGCQERVSVVFPDETVMLTDTVRASLPGAGVANALPPSGFISDQTWSQ